VEQALVEEAVERGELRRDALELLSLLDDPAARRALGAMPLELTEAPGQAWLPERDLPSEAWRSMADWLDRLDAAPIRAAARAVVLQIAERLDPEDEPPAVVHEGLHTGPNGALVISAADAKAWFPLGALVRRAAAASGFEWPGALRERSKARLCAELAGLDWRAVWAARWLAELGEERGDDRVAGAAACVGAYAEGVLGRAETRRVFREALLAHISRSPAASR